jgi:hypothetical protein
MVVMPVSPALHQAKTGGSQVQLLVNLMNFKSAWATPLDPEIPRQRDFQFSSSSWDELVTFLDHHPGGCDMHNYHHGHFILFYEWGWKSFLVIDNQFHDFLLTSTKFSSAFHSSLYINDIAVYIFIFYNFAYNMFDNTKVIPISTTSPSSLSSFPYSSCYSSLLIVK